MIENMISLVLWTSIIYCTYKIIYFPINAFLYITTYILLYFYKSEFSEENMRYMPILKIIPFDIFLNVYN